MVSFNWVNGGSACVFFRHIFFFLAWYGLRCIGRVSAVLGNVYEINCNTILIKDTMILYRAQPCYPLNSQVLVILFPSATTPAMPHYPEFTDRYSPQYSMLSFSFHFMTNTFLQLPSPPLFHCTSFLNHTASLILDTTIPDPTDKTLIAPPPPSLSHLPDLGCVGAQRIMFLSRFLV